MCAAIQFGSWNRRDRQTGLSRQRGHARIIRGLEISVLLAEVVVQIPGYRFVRFDCEQERIRLEPIEVFGLIRPVYQPVLKSKLVVHVVSGSEAHVVER